MEPETRLIQITEAARRLGLSAPALRYHLTFGRVADVSTRTASGGRVFSEADLQRIATALGRQLRAEGYEESGQAGQASGVPVVGNETHDTPPLGLPSNTERR
jgi:hypothetical protein